MSEKPNTSGKEMIRLGAVLFAITFVVALALGFVNSITEEKIIVIQDEIIKEAMGEVMPGVTFGDMITDTGSDMVVSYAEADNGGHCFITSSIGFGGPLTVIVGIDADSVVTGVKVTKHTETPGLGAKSQDPKWIEQFEGTTAGVAITKSEPNENQVLSISGSTITSNAVAAAVNAACDYEKNLG